jgi:predicted nucleic acid-binding Zn ribbon protein
MKVPGPIKKGNEYTLREAIQELLESYQLNTKLDEVKAVDAWERIMGPAIARHTRHVSISNRTLYIEINSAALRQELSYGKSRIRNLLNEAAGADVIDDVILR